MSAAKRWGVVGGGLLGMTLAHTLASRAANVSLLEAAPHLGGLADAWKLGEITWDRHYHVTLLSDSATRDLLRELGLENGMQWRRSQTGFYSDGQLYPFSNAVDFARFPLLSAPEKLRLGWTIWTASRLKDCSSIKNLTVEDWLVRLSGKNVFEKIWRPLLRAKLGEDYRTTSATFIWATIQRLYAARRSGLKEEMFGYLPGGYGAILERFTTVLKEKNVNVLCNAAVGAVRRAANQVEVLLKDGEALSFDRVIVTLPTPIAAEICVGLSDSEKECLKKVTYLGIVCGSALLERPFSPYYVTNILDSSIPFTGLIEMSALVDAAQINGHGLLYLPRYLPSQHEDFSRSDEDLREEMTAALKRMHPKLCNNALLAFRISKARHVFPRPTAFAESIPPIDTSVPGLTLVNSAHIVNGTLNVNETVSLARREALRLHAVH